ncbi:MAG: peptidoglycan editing factor PgeF, partial [Oscillospiraceae bacterium]
VMKNYELVAKDLNVDMRRMVLSKQTHTDNIRLVTDSDAGKGVVRVSDIEDTDGLITNIPGISLVIFSADCVPLLFLDPVKKVVAASHAGWRGTVMGIGKKTIRCMAEEYGCEPKNILVAIGPSIGKCCFEVDGDTAKNFDDKYKIPKENGKFHIDLWSVNFDQIKQAGVKCENIRVSEECTICKADRYYSYRTQKEHTGRQGAIISLR